MTSFAVREVFTFSRFVVCHVNGASHEDKIFNTVVVFNAIDVMNDFTLDKGPS